MVAELLSFEFVDASSAIVFDYTGVVNEEASKAKINQCLKRYKKIVVPGFYGGYPNGAIKLFERGGGDITGALLASFVGVDYYENWTDVSGVLSADPHQVEKPFTIPEVTYNEMRLLSCSGAQVLHRDAIKPLEKLGISMRIKNTLFPCDKGTLIKKSRGNCKQFFSSVTVKNNMFSVCFKGKEKELALVFNLLAKCSSLNSLVALDDGYRVIFEIINADLFECARKELLQKIEDVVLGCNLSVVSVIMCGKSFSCSDFSSAVNIVGGIANRGCCFPNLNDNLMSFCVGSDEVDAVVLSLHNAFCGYNAQQILQ
jgi:aspartate kinase